MDRNDDYADMMTGYEHMNLSEGFWTAYCEENEDNVLSQWVMIGARDFNVSSRTLNKLSRACKYFFSAVQWRLTRCKLLREKWAPVIAPKLYRYLLMKSHPIKYTGYAAKTIPINEELGVGPFGVRLLDTLHPIFSEDELAASKYAFANVSFRARRRVPFVMVVFIATNAIMSIEVNVSDYLDTGEDAPEILAKYREEYGDNPSAYPGRYIVNLHLPTKYNPITLGKPLVQPNRIHFCIARGYILSYCRSALDQGIAEQVADINFDAAFVLDVFTHAVIHFKTVDCIINSNDSSQSAYNWAEYGMTFNGKINSHVMSTSLIRRIDDPDIKKEDECPENAEILINGFYNGAQDENNDPVEYYSGSDSEDGKDGGGFDPWYYY